MVYILLAFTVIMLYFKISYFPSMYKVVPWVLWQGVNNEMSETVLAFKKQQY